MSKRYGRVLIPIVLFGTLIILNVGPGAAQPVPLGTEFQVNSYTTSEQYFPAVASSGDGQFVVVWESRDQDGSLQGVFGQRVDSTGTNLGVEFQVNSYTTSEQYFPRVSSDPEGDFVVVWGSYGQDGSEGGIFAQRFGSDGGRVGTEFQVNTYTTYQQALPSVGLASNGDFVVTWQEGGFLSHSHDGDWRDIFGQRFNSAGTTLGEEFRVNSYTTGNQSAPRVAMAPGGTFVVVWEDGNYFSGGRDGDGFGIFARRFASSGTPVGWDFDVNSTVQGHQVTPDLTALDGAEVVIAWRSDTQYYGGYSMNIDGLRFDSAGDAVGTEFQVNHSTTEENTYPSVSSFPNGHFVVSWSGYQYNRGTANIVGRHFDNRRDAVGADFPISETPVGNPWVRPEVATAGNSSFLVAWHDEVGQYASQIKARVFSLEVLAALCGDFNGDENITVTDALGILKGAVGGGPCPPTTCDVDSSGMTNVTDALKALMKAVGKPIELICPAE